MKIFISSVDDLNKVVQNVELYCLIIFLKSGAVILNYQNYLTENLVSLERRELISKQHDSVRY